MSENSLVKISTATRMANDPSTQQTKFASDSKMKKGNVAIVNAQFIKNTEQLSSGKY